MKCFRSGILFYIQKLRNTSQRRMGSCFGESRIANIKEKNIEVAGYKVQISEKISQGGYGDIWKCRDLSSGKIYAAKQIKLQTKELEKMYEKEVKWLQKFNQQEGVIKLIGHTEIKSKDKSYETGIILTEFYEMNLLDKLKNKKFTPFEILLFLKNILPTLQMLHTQNCIHLDIKPQNILISVQLDNHDQYRICDFGSCIEGPLNIKQMSKPEKAKFKQYIQANSTMIYRAPQLIDIEGMTQVIGEKTDMWMLGCIAYFMLYRKHPFQEAGPLAILTGCHNYPQIPDKDEFFDELIEIIKLMLVVPQQNRISDSELLVKIQSKLPK